MLYKMLVAPLVYGGGGDVAEVDGVVGDDEPDGVVEPPSDGVAGVVGVLGVPLAATTVIANFMPLPQWPGVEQMKYIGPAADKVIVELPPV